MPHINLMTTSDAAITPKNKMKIKTRVLVRPTALMDQSTKKWWPEHTLSCIISVKGQPTSLNSMDRLQASSHLTQRRYMPCYTPSLEATQRGSMWRNINRHKMGGRPGVSSIHTSLVAIKLQPYASRPSADWVPSGLTETVTPRIGALKNTHLPTWPSTTFSTAFIWTMESILFPK